MIKLVIAIGLVLFFAYLIKRKKNAKSKNVYTLDFTQILREDK